MRAGITGRIGITGYLLQNGRTAHIGTTGDPGASAGGRSAFGDSGQADTESQDRNTVPQCIHAHAEIPREKSFWDEHRVSRVIEVGRIDKMSRLIHIREGDNRIWHSSEFIEPQNRQRGLENAVKRFSFS